MARFTPGSDGPPHHRLQDSLRRTKARRLRQANRRRRRLRLGQEKTESEATVDECLTRAKQAVRARNFAGSILWLRKCVETLPMSPSTTPCSRAASPPSRNTGRTPSAISRSPSSLTSGYSTYFQFGELYEAMGLPWRAVPLYRRVLEIDPSTPKPSSASPPWKNEGDAAKPKSERSFLSRLLHGK